MKIKSIIDKAHIILSEKPTLGEINNFVSAHGFDIYYQQHKDSNYPELIQEEEVRPEWDDLIRLYKLITQTNRTTILEFGCGFSSLVFVTALNNVKNRKKDEAHYLRKDNLFEVHSIDNINHFIEVSKSRIPLDLKDYIKFYLSDIEAYELNGKFTTRYVELPLINPDFIYLDAPDQFSHKGDINGISTRHNDFMPMASDILLIEHFLIPGTIIVIDGRAANTRFLKCNLQRDWEYIYNDISDQHLFILNEEPLGKFNSLMLSFYDDE